MWGCMKILICDDEAHFLEMVKAHVSEYMANRFIPCQIVATSSSNDVLRSTERFDLAFLDIQMADVDGISLAKALKSRNPKLIIFFVTNYDAYQDDAMDLQAFRYFGKPFDVARLYAGLDKAMEYIDGAYVDVFVQEGRASQRILVDDILYVTREERKTAIITRESTITTPESFDSWCEKLPTLFFYAVHKSYLVNLHYVDRYCYSELYLTNAVRVPIAPRKQSAFHKFWFGYLRGR